MNPIRIAVASSLMLASIASADIGFPAAVTASRAAAPLGTLFSIQQRVRNGAMVYEGDLFNASLTTRYQARLNLDTGDLIRLDINGVSDAARASLQPIADRLGEVQVDFAAAIDAANASTQRSDVQKVAYDLEAGILAYQVDYFDGVTKAYIDSVTGGVIPHHMPDDDMDPTNPATSVLSAIGIAAEHKGASWAVIGLENEAEKGGNIVQVLLVDLKSGMLSQINVGGSAILSETDFAPVGGQVAKVAAIRANWGSVHTSLAGAVAEADAAYPGAGVVEASLKIAQEDAGLTIRWKLNLITADLIQIDYFVDATAAGGMGFRFAAAPAAARVGDYNYDGVVNALDITEVFSAWGATNPLMDIDGDGLVGSAEVAAVISNWG